jgi:hypothetical protein
MGMSAEGSEGRQQYHEAAANARKASVIDRTTDAQSPGLGWRKIRMVGYQGESSRSSNQRQQVSKRFSIQTGFPIAPAR